MVSHPDSSVVGPQIVICSRIVLGSGILNIGGLGLLKVARYRGTQAQMFVGKGLFPRRDVGGGAQQCSGNSFTL